MMNWGSNYLTGWHQIPNVCALISNSGPEREFNVQMDKISSANIQYITVFFSCPEVLWICTYLILLSSFPSRPVLMVLNQVTIEEIQKITLWLFILLYTIILQWSMFKRKANIEKKTYRAYIRIESHVLCYFPKASFQPILFSQ